MIRRRPPLPADPRGPIPPVMSHGSRHRRRAILPLAAGALLVLAGCDRSAAYADRSGEEIYARLCTQCHGDEGRALHGRGGTYLGKRKYWTRETLLEYLDDPQAYKRKAPHLTTSRYMPPISGAVPAEARVRLVDHVLGLMDALDGAGD